MTALQAVRAGDGPIIHSGLGVGTNICGPSLIAAPSWCPAPPGRLMLYFADHRGTHIRLAFADQVTGPWRIHGGGCLDVTASRFCAERPHVSGPPPGWTTAHAAWQAYIAAGNDWLYPHVASPDVHVLADRRKVRMYLHGLLADGDQQTRVAVSGDGITFEVLPDLLGPPYFRAFQHGGQWYALAAPNLVLRSRDGLTAFEQGPALLDPATRHTAVHVRGSVLHVFWTRIGDAPERIFHGTVDLVADWMSWHLAGATEILRPARPWEGGACDVAPSRVGASDALENALRDPCIFDDGGTLWLLYSGGGERAIGAARLASL